MARETLRDLQLRLEAKQKVMDNMTDRLDKLQRIEKTGLATIRDFAEQYGYDFCEDGLESFCVELGIEYEPRRIYRRAIVYVDLEGTPDDVQNAVDHFAGMRSNPHDPTVKRVAVWADEEVTEPHHRGAEDLDPCTGVYGFEAL